MKKETTDAPLTEERFRNPAAEYRSTPFWGWNGELNRAVLEEQIDCMRRMGFGGFYMHPRLNLATPYLSDAFMDAVGACVEKAKDTGMLPGLYDEDRYPSGDAGGMVREADPRNCQKYLMFRYAPYADDALCTADRKKAIRFGGRKYRFLARFAVRLSDAGHLLSYGRIGLSDPAPEGSETWFAYLEDAAYCDTLRRETAEAFLSLTHEAYRKRFGGEFGGAIRSVFTDEPQLREKRPFVTSRNQGTAILPFTDDLPESFRQAYGLSLTDHLPELFWESRSGEPSRVRYLYHRHVTERFSDCFIGTVSAWCSRNGLKLTGHMMGEETLDSQTRFIGDAMRHYRYFDLPGVDMLCDNREYTTVLQAVSVAHQDGKPGILSELYGVTNWDFDFRGYRLQGDWQAALGVVHRVPHHYLMSLGGEAKRDYPASIGHQSPWYTELGYLEDHFARLNTVLTRGEPEVGIGVIHPIESYWLNYGPDDLTGLRRRELDERFAAVTEWLLSGLRAFDFINEGLLPEQWRDTPEGFAVGCMTYHTVILPSMQAIRSTTLNALEAFSGHGGRILFLGTVPRYVDGVASDRAEALARRCVLLPWSGPALMQALEPAERPLRILLQSGAEAEHLLHQIRREGDRRYVFISHVRKPDPELSAPETLRVSLGGEWTVWEYETFSGIRRRLAVTCCGGRTEFWWRCGPYDSVLLELCPGRDPEKGGYVFREPVFSEPARTVRTAAYDLQEDNVLLLDRADYAFDGEPWQGETDVLRIDQALRKRTGQSLATGRFRPQPWTLVRETAPEKSVLLRFRIRSEIAYRGAHLALEYAHLAHITLNGAPVDAEPDGYYIDRSVSTVPLPELPVGESELLIRLGYGNVTSVESHYLLGRFGVENRGAENVLVPLPEQLFFGSITGQGMPFYGGNLTYRFCFAGAGRTYLELPKYRGAAVRVSVDGAFAGYIDCPPYRVFLGNLPAGTHRVELKLLGTRFNTLGQLHHVSDRIPWPGPDSWRTTGSAWTDEYLFRRLGILASPRILTEKEDGV